MRTIGYWWDSVIRDVRIAVRLLLRNRTYAAAAIATIAIVIGLNGAVFGSAYAILFKPLPYPDADRLVELRATRAKGPNGASTPYFSALVLDDIAAGVGAFEGVARSTPLVVTEAKTAEPATMTGLQVSADWFRVFGVVPETGRTILPGDIDAEERVAVISHRLRERNFGSSGSALGATLWLSVQPPMTLIPFSPPPRSYSIVGVLSAQQPAPDGADVLIPLPPSRIHTMSGSVRAIPSTTAVARVKAGTSLRAVQDQLHALDVRLAAEYPESDGGREIMAVPLLEALTTVHRRSLLLLLGAVSFVVLLACVSFGGLLLARNRARQQEIAVRACLGASRGRLIQQFVTESLLLGVAGAAAGVCLASWGMRVIRTLAPRGIPRLDQVHLDSATLLYTAGTALACGLLIGCIPAFQVTRRADLSPRTREGFGATSASRPIHARGLLIGCQILIGFPLLVGAMLTTKSLARLIDVDLGFSRDHVTVMTLKLSAASCSKFAACTSVIRDLVQRVESVPGVTRAAVGGARPFGLQFSFTVRTDAASGAAQQTPTTIQSAIVTPGYFDVLGIPLRAGRRFDPSIDIRGGVPVAIVNEAAARVLFGGTALHKRLTDQRNATLEIVGIVGDTRESSLAAAPPPRLYVPLDQAVFIPRTTLIVRASGDAAAIVPAVKQRVMEVDRQAAVSDTATLEQIITDTTAANRLTAVLLSAFAAVSVLLSLIGTVGLISYSVTQRTREFGIRLAIGARPRQILWLVVREGLWTLGWSLALGAGAAVALSSALGSLLFDITATDPLTYGIVAMLVAAIALAGYCLPSRRAMRMAPLAVLRE